MACLVPSHPAIGVRAPSPRRTAPRRLVPTCCATRHRCTELCDVAEAKLREAAAQRSEISSALHAAAAAAERRHIVQASAETNALRERLTASEAASAGKDAWVREAVASLKEAFKSDVLALAGRVEELRIEALDANVHARASTRLLSQQNGLLREKVAQGRLMAVQRLCRLKAWLAWRLLVGQRAARVDGARRRHGELVERDGMIEQLERRLQETSATHASQLRSVRADAHHAEWPRRSVRTRTGPHASDARCMRPPSRALPPPAPHAPLPPRAQLQHEHETEMVEAHAQLDEARDALARLKVRARERACPRPLHRPLSPSCLVSRGLASSLPTGSRPRLLTFSRLLAPSRAFSRLLAPSHASPRPSSPDPQSFSAHKLKEMADELERAQQRARGQGGQLAASALTGDSPPFEAASGVATDAAERRRDDRRSGSDGVVALSATIVDSGDSGGGDGGDGSGGGGERPPLAGVRLDMVPVRPHTLQESAELS